MNQSSIHSNRRNRSGGVLSVFQRKYLEKSLEKDLPKYYSQRIKIMLLADDGKTQAQICQMLGCSQSTARHWIATAKSGLAHQWNNCKIGRPQVMDEHCLQRLRELVTQSPREVKVPNCNFTYSIRYWTGKKLSEHMSAELGIKISDRHINRLLKKMGLSTRNQPISIENNNNKNAKSDSILIAELNDQTGVADNNFIDHPLKNQGFMGL